MKVVFNLYQGFYNNYPARVIFLRKSRKKMLPVIICTILFIPTDVTPEHRTACQLTFRGAKGKQGENEITSGSAIWK